MGNILDDAERRLRAVAQGIIGIDGSGLSRPSHAEAIRDELDRLRVYESDYKALRSTFAPGNGSTLTDVIKGLAKRAEVAEAENDRLIQLMETPGHALAYIEYKQQKRAETAEHTVKMQQDAELLERAKHRETKIRVRELEEALEAARSEIGHHGAELGEHFQDCRAVTSRNRRRCNCSAEIVIAALTNNSPSKNPHADEVNAVLDSIKLRDSDPIVAMILNQTSLDTESARILRDNLWDLYEQSSR